MNARRRWLTTVALESLFWGAAFAIGIWALLGLIAHGDPATQPVNPVRPKSEFIDMMRGRVALTCYFIVATVCCFFQTLTDPRQRTRQDRVRSPRR